MKKFIKDLFNVPNTISLFRLVATPFLPIAWFVFHRPDITLLVGVVVGITDLFDGILARKLNQITDLGALIDQLGDLIFESTCLLIAIVDGHMWMGWLLIYLFREFTVTVIRTYVYSKGGKLPSSWIGKAKSSCLQWAFFLLFLGVILSQPDAVPGDWHIAGITPGWLLIHGGMLSIITGLAVGLLSGWQYLKAFAAFYIEQTERTETPAE
ncbi:MAG: CDP-alcohol phosphatidyltransferase family protein [Deltaproteobacteria bacterium]|nr:CDP-alcohol phosphatidyltransferase family protein [Deltaproteobacteria bacterium]MBN2671578.1 CDP-alcohol phosphatidyltransferase family protein [Deltaproteobacteria bacterium]